MKGGAGREKEREKRKGKEREEKRGERERLMQYYKKVIGVTGDLEAMLILLLCVDCFL